MIEHRRLQRVSALRMRGQWTVSAVDGAQVGIGAGFSWWSAVREALHDLDDKHTKQPEQKERPCGTA
jgi:hypothetical protein